MGRLPSHMHVACLEYTHLIEERPCLLILSCKIHCIDCLVDWPHRPQEWRLAGAQDACRGSVQEAPLGIDERAGKGILVGIQPLQF